MSRPSVVCQSSVTLLYPRQRLELFGNILHRLIAQGRGVCIKFFAQIRTDSTGIVQIQWGYEKLAFFDDYLALFSKMVQNRFYRDRANTVGVWKIGVFRRLSRFISKMVQDTAIVTMVDELELVCDNEWCHI